MATHVPWASVQEGQDWLLSCTPNPEAVQHAWEAEQLAAIPAGAHLRVAEVTLVRSLEAIRRLGFNPHGPVLADFHDDASWWLLPAGLTDELDDVPGLTVHPAGWELLCPPVVRSVGGRWWVATPDGSGRLTDPTLLAAAFGPGGYRPEREDAPCPRTP
ncbi:hypothetical protein [Streptomyces sp. CoH27]|uniref:hypothetical protein n=1 Tax=Streptomyces sp. CoH27 TaxID=2875763 RepID=UPI001CD6F6FE|nr:hypothetical protein [Streptomyces sp. CoH27]